MSDVRGRLAWLIGAGCVIIASCVTLVILSNRPGPQPVREQTSIQPVASVTYRPSGTAAITTSTESDIDMLITQISSGVKPIQWRVGPWDGSSDASPEALQKGKRLMQGFLSNFSKINTLKLHLDTTRSLFENVPGFDKNDWQESWKKSLDIEAGRQPLFFHVTGTWGGREMDVTITPAGKLEKANDSIGYAESLVPAYLDGEVGEIVEEILSSRFDVNEDVALEPRLAESVAVREYQVDFNAKYDVLVRPNFAGGVRTFWFNRKTGMVDFKLDYKADAETSRQPFGSITLYKYRSAGDVNYYSVIDCWGMAVEPEEGINIPDDFQLRSTIRFSRLTVNGVDAD